MLELRWTLQEGTRWHPSPSIISKTGSSRGCARAPMRMAPPSKTRPQLFFATAWLSLLAQRAPIWPTPSTSCSRLSAESSSSSPLASHCVIRPGSTKDTILDRSRYECPLGTDARDAGTGRAELDAPLRSSRSLDDGDQRSRGDGRHRTPARRTPQARSGRCSPAIVRQTVRRSRAALHGRGCPSLCRNRWIADPSRRWGRNPRPDDRSNREGERRRGCNAQHLPFRELWGRAPRSLARRLGKRAHALRFEEGWAPHRTARRP